MIDIHCHIVPGLDDGAQNMATSLAMALIAAADGIEIIIATPHADGLNTERLSAGVLALNDQLVAHNIPLHILSGFEVPHHLALNLASSHTLAGSTYVLVEFPHDYMPDDALALVSDLITRGFQPIIAHPERNRDILADPQQLVELIQAGALAQLTAASITGELGPDSQRCAHYLLVRGLAHFIATDSHSPGFRTPRLSKAHDAVGKLLGKGQAELLTIGNPQKILQSAKKTIS